MDREHVYIPKLEMNGPQVVRADISICTKINGKKPTSLFHGLKMENSDDNDVSEN